jgi:hypothetical protein
MEYYATCLKCLKGRILTFSSEEDQQKFVVEHYHRTEGSFRTGKHVKRTMYYDIGEEDVDYYLGSMNTPEIASFLTAAANLYQSIAIEQNDAQMDRLISDALQSAPMVIKSKDKK